MWQTLQVLDGTADTVHYMLHTVHCMLHTIKCTLNVAHYTMHTLHVTCDRPHPTREAKSKIDITLCSRRSGGWWTPCSSTGPCWGTPRRPTSTRFLHTCKTAWPTIRSSAVTNIMIITTIILPRTKWQLTSYLQDECGCRTRHLRLNLRCLEAPGLTVTSSPLVDIEKFIVPLSIV